MHRAKNTSKRNRTHRGSITFPADATWAALGHTTLTSSTIVDPHMTSGDLVVVNPLAPIAGVTCDALLVQVGTGQFRVSVTLTNVSGAQMNFPGNTIKYGVLPQ